MDRRLLVELLHVFYNPKVVKDKYFFSSMDYYYIPRDPLNLNSALEFIDSLPDKNDPELYGLHPNASISSSILQTSKQISSLLLLPSYPVPEQSSNTNQENSIA